MNENQVPDGCESLPGHRIAYVNENAQSGGFAGWESDVFQRDLVNNTTILSGDLDGLDGDDIADLADGIKCFTGPEEDCFCTALSC